MPSDPPINTRATTADKTMAAKKAKTDQSSHVDDDHVDPTVADNSAAKHANHGKYTTKDSQPPNCEMLEKLQSAVLELESSLASLKVQSNAFETNVSSQLDTIFKRLPTDPNTPVTPAAKYESEILKLRDENNKLRNRVQHLEQQISTLQSKSSDFQKDMSEMKTCQSSLKVKVANMKDALLDKVTSTIDEQVPRKQNTVLEYAVATSNRFDALQDSLNLQRASPTELDLETDPKALIKSLTSSKGHTTSHPKNLRQKRKRVVIIGDSNAQKLKPALLSPTADVPKPYWAPTLPGKLSTLEELSKDKSPPSTVIFHVGTNDVVAKSKEEIVDDFDTMISSTQSLFPNAEVVISAVPPRRGSRQNPEVNNNILDINNHLRDRCQANSSFTFVSHAKLWSNGDYNKAMFERDGYHLNSDGVRVLAYNIKKQATQPLGLEPRNLESRRRQDNGGNSPTTSRRRYSTNEHPKSQSNTKFNMPRTREGQQGRAPQSSGQRGDRPDTPRRGRQEPSIQGYRLSQYMQAPNPIGQYPPGPLPAPGPYHPSPMYTEWNRDWPSLSEAYGFPLNPMWFGLPPPPPPPYRNNGPYGTFSGQRRPQGCN
ncbi:hypothetical protein Bbelb_037760 [Branchiostoma belcheri]|nr:hypothetical protein Bbelb_037760 [Branchiostoma belcheri]